MVGLFGSYIGVKCFKYIKIQKFATFFFSQVTVCFSMYVISIIGTIISAAQRVSLFAFFSYLLYRNMEHEWAYTRAVSDSRDLQTYYLNVLTLFK